MPRFSEWAGYWQELQRLENPELSFLKNDIGTLWWDSKQNRGLLFLWEKHELLEGEPLFSVLAIDNARLKTLQSLLE